MSLPDERSAALVCHWRDVHAFWFPAGLAEADDDAIAAAVTWWSGGSSAPALPRFLPTVEAARAGRLDHWREDAAARLALIVVLDQFTRGLFDGTPEAYASDAQALTVAEEGLGKGDYDRLENVFEQTFFLMPLVHTEGQGHLERLAFVETATARRLAEAPAHLKSITEFSLRQARGNIDVISRFGRFPHRNSILGRASTPEEMAYIERGDFVHQRRP